MDAFACHTSRSVVVNIGTRQSDVLQLSVGDAHCPSSKVLVLTTALRVICRPYRLFNYQTDSECREEPGHELLLFIGKQIDRNFVLDDPITYKSVAAVVKVTVVTGNSLVSFRYRSVKKILK